MNKLYVQGVATPTPWSNSIRMDAVHGQTDADRACNEMTNRIGPTMGVHGLVLSHKRQEAVDKSVPIRASRRHSKPS